MKTIILDCLRRWKWMWLFWSALHVLMLCGMHLDPSPRIRFTGIILFIGSIQLSLDLRRGAARVWFQLPLSPRQTGRALWLVCVLIPTLYAGGLTLGTLGLLSLYKPGASSWTSTLPLPAIYFLVYGAMFYLQGQMHGPHQGPMAKIRSTLAAIIWGGSFGAMFGWIDLRGVLNITAPWQFVVLGTLMLMTAAGWFQADRWMLQVAGRTGAASPASGAAPFLHGPFFLERHFSGLSLLVADTSFRLLLMVFGILGLTCLFFWLFCSASGRPLLSSLGGGAMGSGFLMAMGFALMSGLSLLSHLPVLRALPMSSRALAAVLMLPSLLLVLLSWVLDVTILLTHDPIGWAGMRWGLLLVVLSIAGLIPIFLRFGGKLFSMIGLAYGAIVILWVGFALVRPQFQTPWFYLSGALGLALAYAATAYWLPRTSRIYRQLNMQPGITHTF